MGDKAKKIEEAKDHTTISRREWMLSLGSAIVLGGTAGSAVNGTAQTIPGIAAGMALPPGLYQASFDHLAHVLMRNEAFPKIPAGAETEYVRPRSGEFHPVFFSSEDFKIIRRLVEIILGEDLRSSRDKSPPDSPSSIYDEVTEWIDLVATSAPAVRRLAMDLPAEQRALAVAYFGSESSVREIETFQPEQILREGLAWLAKASRERFNNDFMSLSHDDQIRLVTQISDLRASESQIDAGTRFFDVLKRESIRGFYTSQVGLGELGSSADTFHPESPGCGITPNL